MGASKSSKVIKNPPKQKIQEEALNTVTSEEKNTKKTTSNDSDDVANFAFYSDVEKEEKEEKTPGKSPKKSSKKAVKSPQSLVFSNRSISNLSRGLGANDWIRLAYALGFLPQGIAHFTGRASSAQNSYSQCTMMLKSWRQLTPPEELLPRLCSALQKIRRHDLAVKMGLELAIEAEPHNDAEKKPKLLLELIKSESDLGPPFPESKKLFNDDNISFLARQILAREEWKRLAYALGFYPDDASQIIASASSSQNLYAQGHLMLMNWRDKTPSKQIIPSLKAAFTRIRRHDLVFLLELGVIAGTEEEQGSSLEKLQTICSKIKKSKKSMGESELIKFSDIKYL